MSRYACGVDLCLEAASRLVARAPRCGACAAPPTQRCSPLRSVAPLRRFAHLHVAGAMRTLVTRLPPQLQASRAAAYLVAACRPRRGRRSATAPPTMSSAAMEVATIRNIDHGLLATCWPVLTETGGSTLGGVTVADGGPAGGLVVCEEDVGGGAGVVVGGGVTVLLTGTTQVEVGKKRPIASDTLKCTSTWTKHFPSALAKSGTDSLVGPFGPIEKSRLS